MRIAVPNKGRLHEPTIDLLERAGLHLENGADRKLYADTVDPDVTVLFARAADIPEYVSDGAADLGITGFDQVQEARVDNVSELLDLEFGRCRLVLAAPGTAISSDSRIWRARRSPPSSRTSPRTSSPIPASNRISSRFRARRNSRPTSRWPTPSSTSRVPERR